MSLFRIPFALAAFAFANIAFADIQIVEDSVETTAEFVVLPSEPPSSLVVKLCGACKPLLIPTSTRSQYFVDREQVELSELKRALAARPKAFVHVVYARKSAELRRVEAFLREGGS